MAKPIWIPENQAARLMDYSPLVFRRLVKSGKIEVAYTSINNRKFHYNKLDIDKAFTAHSNYMQ